jgi:hypothetical protein
MQLTYSTTQARGLVGEQATPRESLRRARHYPQKQHIVDIVVGGNNDGTYTVRVTPPAGYLPQPFYDFSFVASSDSADDIGEGLELAANQGATFPNLKNFLRASYSASTLTLTGSKGGVAFTVSFPSNPNTNLSATTVQSATRSALPLGIAVIEGAASQELDLLGAGTSTSAVLGILMRSPGIEAPLDNSAETIAVGDNCEVLADGDVYVAPEAEVSKTDPVYIRRSGSGQVGALLGAPAGAAAALVVTPTAADDTTYALTITFRGETRTATATTAGDTGATATNVCDRLRTALGTWTGLTFGGTATLTIAGPAGEAVTAVDTGQGVLAVTGTAAVVDAIPAPAGWRWLEGGGPTSNEVAVLQVVPS